LGAEGIFRPNQGKVVSIVPKLFPVFVVAVVVFVWGSGQLLPPRVASHFGVAGQANRFMSDAGYLWFMSVLVVAMALLVVALPNRLFAVGGNWINLPHREYWLGPERRAATIEYLQVWSVRFGYLLVAFLGYIHWLVVRANQVQPPTLHSAWFIGGLAVFVASTWASAGALLWRFSRIPPRCSVRLGPGDAW
jgi:uncharacterized protein DUF1648